MDRLMAMKVFAQIAANGSFTATAVQLDMSRAMVTRAISDLEEWLDTRLLQRTTRRVTLTDMGEHFLRGCHQILALTDEVVEETRNYNLELRGQLRIACSMSFGHAQMASAITDFLALHPLLKIDMNLNDTSINLVDARIDLAIRISNNPDPLLVGRKLAVCASAVVAASAYIAAQGQPQRPDELVNHRCLTHVNVGKSIWNFSRANEAEQVEIKSYFSANDSTALLQGTLAGAGISLLPTYLANEHINSGKLVALLPDWALPDMNIFALYPSRRHLAPAVREFVDFLVKRFAQLSW